MRTTTTARTTRGLTAGTLLAGLVALVPSAADASASDSMTFGAGRESISAGANAMIMIDGSIRYENNCRRVAARNTFEEDWIYPATDVYIVPTGSILYGQELKDAGGEGPNTIVGTGSGAFLGELIAVTTPSGTLGDGDFDVVFDTCQDGMVDTADTIFSNVIHIDVPDGDVPPVDPSIRRLKDAAREEYASWIKTHVALTMLFKLDDAKSIAACLLAPNPACLLEVLAVIQDVDHSRAPFEDWIEGIVLGEVMQTAKKWGAIWKDPADPDFDTLPGLTAPATPEIPASGRAVADAVGALAEPLGREGVLAEELLHALERYQGAQEAGDEAWALVQARAVRDVADTLDAHLAEDSAAEDLRAAMTPRLAALVAAAEEGEAQVRRIQTQGLTPTEQRHLTNQGLDAGEINDVEAAYVAQGVLHAPSEADLRATLDDLVAARTETRAALQETAAGWDELVDALESSGSDVFPSAAAGGPYRTDGSGLVRLDASASSAGRDGARTVSADWDVDGDGQYDDASGFTVETTVGTTRTVAVRVTDADGKAGVDLAHVSRTDGDRPPVVSAATPDPAVTVVSGASTSFSVSATDPDGDPLTYQWTHRGEVVTGATGSTYSLTADELGAGALTVRATGKDRSAVHTWMVTVVGPDADGDGWSRGPDADCDDTRADVHPQGYERPGNGRDDDCSAATPDAPLGGPLGRVEAWGHPSGIGLPPRPNADLPYWSPVPVLSLGEVRAITSVYRGGFAVDDDGALWGWGENFNGRIGDDTQTKRWSPVPVLGIGGGSGTQLTGVRSVAGEGTFSLALMGGGNVAAWGANALGQLGTNDPEAMGLHPRVVVDGSGVPIDDVVQVETGENGSLAVLADGRVMDWGVVSCDDAFADTTRRTAAVNPLYGDDVLQVAAGDHGGSYVLKRDGSVWSCGGYDDALGRPFTQDDQNDLRPVTGLGSGMVDIAMGKSTGAALDEDGGVWLWGRNTNHELDVIDEPATGVQKLPEKVTSLPAGPPIVDIELDTTSTLHATRADGSVLVWGVSTNGSAGTGGTGSVLSPEIQQVPLGDVVPMDVTGSVWNGLALVRPKSDPDFEPAVQWVSAEVADATIGEATGGSATLTLSEAAPVALSVAYQLADQPVREVEIAAGATTVTLPISAADDALDENDEQLALTVVSISRGVRIDRGTAVVTVIDDDAAPVVSAGDVTAPEGDTSLTDVTVPVRLDAASGKDVEVLWAAVEAGVQVGSGHVLIPAGDRSVDVHVQVPGDTTPGPGRSVVVTLSEPVNARLGGDGTVTLTDDDPVRLEVTAPAVTEGDSGTAPAAYSLRVEGLPAGETLEVPWVVVPGTAELGTDVLAGDGSVTLSAVTPERQAVASVVGDTRAEPLADEVFGLSLNEGKSLKTSTGREVLLLEVPKAVVTDDDAGPTVDAGVPLVLDEGGSVTVKGTSSAPATWSVIGGGCTVAAPGSLETTLSCTASGEAELTLTADDGVNDPATATVGVTVRNVAPSLRITAPAPGTVVPLGQAVSLTAVATDPGDPVTCSVTWGDGSAPQPLTDCAGTHTYASTGSFTATVTASDGQGGDTTATVAVTVQGGTTPPAYPFDGFYAPVDNPSVVNVVKAGSAVPVKFSLGGNRGMDIFRAGFPASSPHPCGTTGTADELEQTVSPGASELTYDAGSQRYQFNWKTQKSWTGSCRTLVVTLTDGRTKTAEFKFK